MRMWYLLYIHELAHFICIQIHIVKYLKILLYISYIFKKEIIKVKHNIIILQNKYITDWGQHYFPFSFRN